MNAMLIIAGLLSTVAAILHLGCIYFGASWYRFLGAGEQMAIMAEQGRIQATVITLSITFVLAVWALYAFSAAGAISQLPFARIILVIISAIYLLRGIAGFFLVSNPLGRTAEFWLWSSSICLIVALVHIIGLKQVWALL
ncbi:hypothetical protein EKO29_12390 [Colwellia sp. Arc7-635]|uniref:hypothetical protein n=1 Tax=Colwellia sp. Arc7-635 TaxID=2497879 RepID=UPI000F856000|nr:hypothetical protein [Colwellia sp. Arc7-635]AZQ84726.1 hypothetical protein EKO29_12390 [Colwellia sp. Arc7-635]